MSLKIKAIAKCDRCGKTQNILPTHDTDKLDTDGFFDAYMFSDYYFVPPEDWDDGFENPKDPFEDFLLCLECSLAYYEEINKTGG